MIERSVVKYVSNKASDKIKCKINKSAKLDCRGNGVSAQRKTTQHTHTHKHTHTHTPRVQRWSLRAEREREEYGTEKYMCIHKQTSSNKA